MAKVVFTPWKEHSQLLSVRNQFYPLPGYDGLDMRSKACALVGVWKLRGNLPHPVEATALLTDAILHDDAQKNSIFSIRATYSAAFCRFVTGLVDSKLHGQKRTMFQRAMDLGLPASFVELRHEATHRELPSLIVLRNATQRSLEWLWDYYWAKVDFDGALVPGATDSEVAGNGEAQTQHIRNAVRAALEHSASQEDSSEPPRKKRKSSQHSSFLTMQFVSICKANRNGPRVLSRVLVEDSVLIPKGRKLGESMDELFATWDKSLQAVATEQSVFLPALTEELVNGLAFTNQSSTKTDAKCEAIYMWLDHILRSAQWSIARQSLSLGYILTVCEKSSNHWTNQLKDVVRREDDDLSAVPGRQGPVSATSQKESKTWTSSPDDFQGLQKYGWDTVDTWDSRPMGVV